MTNVPVTFAGGLGTNTFKGQLWIDSKVYLPPSHSGEVFWYVVLNLSNLSDVPVNIVSSDRSTVPPEVAHYAGQYDYMLFFASINATVPGIPQGELYNFLRLIGAGDTLDSLEQVAAQTSSGLVSNYSYTCSTTMAQAEDKAIESLSFSHVPIVTLQLMPVVIDGKTAYTPVQVGSAVI